MVHDKSCRPDDHDDLGKLRRLERKASDRDPSPCAVVVFTEQLDEDQDRYKRDIEHPVKILNPHIIRDREKQQRGDAQDHSDDLLGPGVGVRASDNGKPDHGQDQNERKKSIIVLFYRVGFKEPGDEPFQKTAHMSPPFL